MNLKLKVRQIPVDDSFCEFLAAVDDATESNASVSISEDNAAVGEIDLESENPLVDLIALHALTTRFGVLIESIDELVTASDIAARSERARSGISHLIAGIRGKGDFPKPINPGARHELFRWTQVNAWLNNDDQDVADRIAFLDSLARLTVQASELRQTQDSTALQTINPFTIASEWFALPAYSK
jgi:hypothetical protein